MLDIPRLERIRLSRHPLSQRLVGNILTLNYKLLPGIGIAFENAERLPDEPVIFAMNHTDRYNYFPFQWRLWKQFDRFTATWVKGKYYEKPLMGAFMEKMNQLPTVSRGYIITKDFASTCGRTPTDAEYASLRRWVDSAATGVDVQTPDPQSLPDVLLSQPREVLGYAFDPAKEDYAGCVNSIFRIMMSRFVALNREVVRVKLDLLIFPQGTRSVRLLPGHVGISQIALHLKVPIVPIGCNGSDRIFPGGSPWGRKGRIVYRFGHPLRWADLAPFHIDEDYEPFSAEAEKTHARVFSGLADLVTDRIEELLDERHRRAPEAGLEAVKGADRFL